MNGSAVSGIHRLEVQGLAGFFDFLQPFFGDLSQAVGSLLFIFGDVYVYAVDGIAVAFNALLTMNCRARMVSPC